jgi:hypothetical protein
MFGVKRASDFLATVVLSSLALAGFACGGGKSNGDIRFCNDGNSTNDLHGSYCADSVTFEYTDVKIQRYPDAMSFVLVYSRPLGAGVEKTLQIVLQETMPFPTNMDIQILDADHMGQVERILADGAQNLTSQLDPAHALIRFTAYSDTMGAQVQGTFGLNFKSGRALGGDFSGPMTVQMPTM